MAEKSLSQAFSASNVGVIAPSLKLGVSSRVKVPVGGVVAIQLRNTKWWMSRVLTHTEGNTEASNNGKDVEIRRSHQAVARKKRYTVELGKPQRLLTYNLTLWHGTGSNKRGKPLSVRFCCLNHPVAKGYKTGGKLVHTWIKFYTLMGCLIRHSTQSMGKPCTRGRI